MSKSAKKMILEAFSRDFGDPKIERLKRDCPGGELVPNIGLEDGERVFGIYRKKYYLTPQRLIITTGKTRTSVQYQNIHRIRTVCGGVESPNHVLILQSGADIELQEPDFFLNIVIGVLTRLKPRVARGRVKIVGPPHLQPYAAKIGPKLRRLFEFEAGSGEWLRMIRCDCGAPSLFSIRYSGERRDVGTIADVDLERQRVDLLCNSCLKRIVLFDAWRHGYDAALCEDSANAPKPRKATKRYACDCGGKSFSVAVNAEYSLERDELADFEPEQWDHTFTWFASMILCSECGTVVNLVDYECA